MAFKPYCEYCRSWHKPHEPHQDILCEGCGQSIPYEPRRYYCNKCRKSFKAFGVFNINSLDPDDPYGCEPDFAQDARDEDTYRDAN